MTNLQNHAVEQQLENAKEDISDYSSLSRLRRFMCGWGALVAAGIMSFTFLLCISFVPSTNIFPAHFDPYADMVPFTPQGNVRVYPPFRDSSAVMWRNDTYFITLPPTDLASATESLSNIIKSYPQDDPSVYRQCWLQNPTYDHPCFFDIEWVGSECTEGNDFGYREVNGTFSPCVILRIEDTGEWAPVPDIHASHHSMTENDPGFVKVYCNLKFPRDARKFKSILVTPQKGFSRMYFPISKFDPKLYLSPIVTVQVKELAKGENVTMFCQVGAQNAFFLEDSGLVTITFGT